MLALLAGTGALPGVLVAALTARGAGVIICEMAGFPVTGTGTAPRLAYRIETLGTLLATLRARGVPARSAGRRSTRPPSTTPPCHLSPA